jgi:C-terminal processing protease CtpA/Prc
MIKSFLLMVFVAAAFVKAAATTSIPTPYFADVVFKYLENIYVNPTNLDIKKTLETLKAKIDTQCQKDCTEKVIEPLLALEIKKLGDKHLNYFQRYAFKGFDDTLPEENQPIGSSFGILVRELNNQIVVVGVNPVTDQKFSVGDVIIAIDNTKINNLDVFKGFERKGAVVQIQAQSKQKLFTVTVLPTEQPWQNQSVRLGKVLHIRLNTVATDFDDRFIHNQIRDALKNNLDGVVLDLRDCFLGGRTFAAVNVAAAFVNQIGLRRRDFSGKIIDYSYDKGQLFYYEEAKDFRDSRPFPEPALWGKKIVVLTSKYTFSACENVASYLQEKNRAQIVGETTVGGGGVTTEQQYTSAQYTLIFARQRHFHLPSDKPQVLQVIPDKTIPFDMKAGLEFGRDLQLEYALNLLKN